MGGPTVVPVVDEGLGNSAYLVDLGDGRALAVDASRDLRTLREATAKRNLTVAYAADTHLHADFLSGALDLAASDSATVLASAAGGREFDHVGLADGDEVDLGGFRLHAADGMSPAGSFGAYRRCRGQRGHGGWWNRYDAPQRRRISPVLPGWGCRGRHVHVV